MTYNLTLAVPPSNNQQGLFDEAIKFSSATQYTKVTNILQNIAEDDSLSLKKKKKLYV